MPSSTRPYTIDHTTDSRSITGPASRLHAPLIHPAADPSLPPLDVHPLSGSTEPGSPGAEHRTQFPSTPSHALSGVLEALPTVAAYEAMADSSGVMLTQIMRAIQKGVAHYIRQSDAMQGHHNLGSTRHQLDQAKYLKAFNVQPDQVQVFDARGERAGEGATRVQFERLLTLITHGKIGLVLVSAHDRIARDDEVAARLFKALGEAGGLLCIGGQFLNPRNPSDLLLLKMQAIFAAHENRMRRIRMVLASAALASKHAFPINLPAGLVWADVADPQFQQAMRETGLEHWLATVPSQHKACWNHRGRPHYVMPLPDRDVYAAICLRYQWLLETCSLDELLARMQDPASGWPRPGYIPAYPWRAWAPGQVAVWLPIGDLAMNPNREADRSQLRDSLRAPAYFGTYRYVSKSIRKFEDSLQQLGGDVRTPNAFPGYFGVSAEDQHRVRELTQSHTRPWQCGSFQGPRDAALRMVRCAHRRADGHVCGAKLTAVYTNALGRHRYQGCSYRGHTSAVRHHLDTLVLDALRDTFGPDGLREQVDQLQAELRTDSVHTQRLREQVKGLEKAVTFAADEMQRAAGRADIEDLALWRARRDEKRKQLVVLRDELADSEASSATAKALTEEEWATAREVAGNVPALLDLAARVPGATRQVVDLLVRCVWVRCVGTCTFYVELEFPTGERIARILFQRLLKFPQPAAAYAFAQLKPWLSPEVLEKEPKRAREAAERAAARLNCMYPTRVSGRARWSPDRAMAAAWWYAYAPEAAPRIHAGASSLGAAACTAAAAIDVQDRAQAEEGQLTAGEHISSGGAASAEVSAPLDFTVAEIAAHVGAPATDVERAALAGRLGPARAAGDELRFVPHEEELCRVFPEYARRTVAAAWGVAVEDLLTAAEVQRRLDIPWGRMTSAYVPAAPVMHDAAGTRYVRQQDYEVMRVALDASRHRRGLADLAKRHGGNRRAEREACLDRALGTASAEHRARDRRYWLPMEDARQRYPGTGHAALRDLFPHLRVPLPRGGTMLFLWIDPARAKALRTPALSDAVTALGCGLDPDDFLPRVEAMKLVDAVLTAAGRAAFNRKNWKQAVKAGRILELHATATGRLGRPRCYSYFPRTLRERATPDAIVAWRNGWGLPVRPPTDAT